MSDVNNRDVELTMENLHTVEIRLTDKGRAVGRLMREHKLSLNEAERLYEEQSQ
jgi:hypothetical protein